MTQVWLSRRSALSRIAIALASASPLAGCVTAPPGGPALRSRLAPTGTLRIGIDYGSAILAVTDPASGALRGVDVDLARELGRRVGAPVTLVPYAVAERMIIAMKNGELDAALLCAQSAHVAEIDLSPAYVAMDATCLVPAGSTIRNVADVDAAGVRVAVADGSACDFFLRGKFERATLQRAVSAQAAYELFRANRLEALAGLRPRLLSDSAMLPGSRVLDGRLGAIEQSIASPRGNDAAAAFLREFVEDAKASGLIAAVIENNGVRGVSAAARTPAR